MAKDLQWFKFNVSDLLAGDILFCSDAAQGVFYRLCALYWARECNLTRKQALKHLPGRDDQITELIADDIIKLENEHIRISFLDEQKKAWYEVSAARSEAGKLGGRGNKKADRKAKQKQNESTPESKMKAKQSYKEEDKTSSPEKGDGSRQSSAPIRNPSTPSNPAGSGSGIAPSVDPKVMKMRDDLINDIEGYKFRQSEVNEILQEFDEIEDRNVLGAYMQFRRKWRTEEGKKKTPKAKDLIDLFYTYGMLESPENADA